MGGLWIAADIETKPQRLKPVFSAPVSARLKPCPDKSSNQTRSFASAHPGAASGAPTTEKATAKTHSHGGPVVNRGPYEMQIPHPKTGFGMTTDTIAAQNRGSVLLLFVVVIVAVGHFWGVEF